MSLTIKNSPDVQLLQQWPKVKVQQQKKELKELGLHFFHASSFLNKISTVNWRSVMKNKAKIPV